MLRCEPKLGTVLFAVVCEPFPFLRFRVQLEVRNTAWCIG